MSSISIILLNYNSTRLTKKCVRSLLEYKDPQDSYHITVWDNLSTEVPMQNDFVQEEVEVVLSEKNYGFAEGNNRAVEHALRKTHTDYVLLLNNDTRVIRNTVRKLIERFVKEKQAGIIVPKIYFERGNEFHKKDYTDEQLGKVIWYAGGGIDWDNLILFHRGVDEFDRGQFETIDNGGQFATGCCMLTTPKIWKQLRGFDKKYFLYYEDADLSIRLVKQLKKKIVLEPGSVVFHANAGSTNGSGSNVQRYFQTRNRLRFGLQHAPMRTKLALLKQARSQFFHGTSSEKLGILHALEGRWGNQLHALHTRP